MSRRFGIALLSLGLLAFVLPGSRIVKQISERRVEQLPLRVETTLSGLGEDWPATVIIEMHPELGTRVWDGQGGRWLIRRGQVVAGTLMPPPTWVPDLEILVLREEADLTRWARRHDVNLLESELARCGERDCFLVGNRFSGGQLWVDKDRFEVLRVVRPGGRELAMSRYRDWEDQRFPSEITILEGVGEVGSLSVERVSPHRDLGESDLSRAWVEGAPATRAP
ncbi:MAG: hypothetical protein GY725_23435 [bacterium]|nr:hypothetical protein [bacterium]